MGCHLRQGYPSVCLSHKNKKRTFSIHSLECLSFIPNPNNLPMINHIDGNKENNALENLEWIDAKGNVQKNQLKAIAKKGLEGVK